MTTYDEFRRLFEDESPEQKLAILRPEALRLLGKINGYSMLVQILVRERGVPQMPPDFGEWCNQIVAGAEELGHLIGALTDTEHRDILQQEQKDQRLALGENDWAEQQAEFTELQPFPSFMEAVRETADKLGFSLPLDLQMINPFYPAVGSAFSTSSRRVNIDAALAKRGIRPSGFAVTLSELEKDGINVKGQGHEGITTSLDQAVTVLCRWLVDNWELDRLRDEHEWMKLGTIFWG